MPIFSLHCRAGPAKPSSKCPRRQRPPARARPCRAQLRAGALAACNLTARCRPWTRRAAALQQQKQQEQLARRPPPHRSRRAGRHQYRPSRSRSRTFAGSVAAGWSSHFSKVSVWAWGREEGQLYGHNRASKWLHSTPPPLPFLPCTRTRTHPTTQTQLLTSTAAGDNLWRHICTSSSCGYIDYQNPKMVGEGAANNSCGRVRLQSILGKWGIRA